MAACAICEKPVVTYRYVRAKRLADMKGDAFVGVTTVTGRSRLIGEPGSCGGHALADVAAALRRQFGSTPIRMLWAPEPGVYYPTDFRQQADLTLSVPSPAPSKRPRDMRAAHANGELAIEGALRLLFAEGAAR